MWCRAANAATDIHRLLPVFDAARLAHTFAEACHGVIFRDRNEGRGEAPFFSRRKPSRPDGGLRRMKTRLQPPYKILSRVLTNMPESGIVPRMKPNGCKAKLCKTMNQRFITFIPLWRAGLLHRSVPPLTCKCLHGLRLRRESTS